MIDEKDVSPTNMPKQTLPKDSKEDEEHNSMGERNKRRVVKGSRLRGAFSQKRMLL